MTIALVGDLRFGRAVHSLCKLLSLFESVQFSLVSPEALRLPSDYIEFMQSKGHGVSETSNLQEGISQADIVYVTRTQEERFDSPEEALRYKGLLRLNQAVYTEFCQPNTVIMHPLPRDSRADSVAEKLQASRPKDVVGGGERSARRARRRYVSCGFV